ncbi:MAG: iron-sulfur cluster repair di-iron protein [Acidobacteriia bacterium]|nr:iron-sulfur cluster repair di-iron protein [Terriglobia bacterium]
MTSQETVGQIAAENPAAARIFEKYKIDYCCGGAKSLALACAGSAISVNEVLAEVEQATRAAEDRDWAHAGLAELADYIVAQHHTFLKNELPALASRIAKVIEAHATSHGDSLYPMAAAFQGLHSELSTHMLKEEMILFPLIKRMEEAELSGAALPWTHCGSVNNPIRMMEQEHDNAGGALQTMRRVTEDYKLPADACPTYRALYEGLKALEADLHIHIHLENNILFPRASRLEQSLQS